MVDVHCTGPKIEQQEKERKKTKWEKGCQTTTLNGKNASPPLPCLICAVIVVGDIQLSLKVDS
jgi:hypothetical protein